jgi:hypothetical protein
MKDVFDVADTVGVDLPRRSILISLRCAIRSRFNWFSISSFRALPSFSSVLIPQPILAVICRRRS